MTGYKKLCFLILTFFTVIALNFLFFIKLNVGAPLEKRTQKQPQEYMTNVQLNTFTEEGTLKNTLSAKYWAYLPEKQISTLDLPRLTVYKPDNTVWHINAKRGQMEQPTLESIEQIILQENVVLERPKTLYATALKLESDELKYQPKIQYAKTDEFVTITKPGLKMTGLGMRAFLDKGSMKLLHNVKTYYTKMQ